MRTQYGRTLVLLIGGALSTAGWGAVFPFLYADVSTARHLGSGVAAVTFTAFAVGSILAAPVAGTLADRFNAAGVAAGARLALAAFIVGLAYFSTATGIWLAAAGFGAALAISQPAMQIILLARTDAARRRDVFAWQFIANNLGLAGGAALGGVLVDLSSQAAMRPVYAIGAISAVVSAAVVWVFGRCHVTHVASEDAPDETFSYRALLARKPIRWLLAVSLLITLACYAQFDSGLPAFVLAATDVTPAQLGTGVALNAVLVGVLTGPVVARTRHRDSTALLRTCAAIWIGCWLVFGLPLFLHGHDEFFVLFGLASISVGETMMAPILSPLAASLAPDGATGRTLAATTGAGTVATAVGPMLAGAVLGLHLPAAFIAMQIGFCVAAVAAAGRLRTFLPSTPLDSPSGQEIVATR